MAQAVRMRNRLAGVGLGLLVGLAVALLPARRPPAPWDLIPENEGALRTVALQYTAAAAADILPAYRAFLSQADPSVEVVAVCGSTEDATAFRQALASWGVESDRVRSVVVGTPITAWCKDRFLVGRGRRPVLLCPELPGSGLAGRDGDSLVAGAIAKSLPGRFSVSHSGLAFDAGDIVATGAHVFISDVLWEKNHRPARFDERLRQAFGRDVVHLHGAPDHHIGMYAAPLDGKTVLVGDREMAKRLWSPALERALGQADFREATTAPFRRAAEQLRAAGFQVVPVPLAPLGPQTYVTYTNGVFETRDGRRIVYMPWYDAPALDESAATAYRSAGWEVRPIPVRTLYRYRGTIGCLVNVLGRG